MQTLPTAPVVATGLIGGFAIARYSGRREVGGLFLAACGTWNARRWTRQGGSRLAVPLTAAYVGAFGASHPLAKRIGPWPSVLAVTALAAGAAAITADRA